MKKLLLSLLLLPLSATASDVIWTPVFYHIMPNNPKITKAYCISHTPNVLKTTIAEITSKNGVTAENGVHIRYNSYKEEKENGLYFNIVDATIWGIDAKGKPWSEHMKLYEQTLTPTGITNTVWATDNCKGKFIGTSNQS